MQKLSNWLFRAPAKFAMLSFGLMVVIGLVYSFIIASMNGGNITPSQIMPMFLIMGVGIIIAIIKLVRWLPNDNLDRRSFVMVDNGLTLGYAIVSICGILISYKSLVPMFTQMQTSSPIVAILCLVLISIVMLYMFGISIANMYATYRRARGMGVPRYKALMAFPFTIAIYWFPGYFLDDDKKKKPVLTTDTKWFAALTDWILARRRNAVIAFLIMTLISALVMFDWFMFVILGLFAVVFVVWAGITGAKKFMKNIGGAFATFAYVLNIALIVGLLVVSVI